ncbi:putative ATP-dependent DNA helicase HFM1 [Ciona intestinalis]
MTVPETPFVVNEKIATSEESFDLNLDDSDGEDRGAIFGPSLRTPSCVQLPPKRTPGGHMKDGVKLRPIEEIPDKYRSVFNGIPCFNVVQSKVFEDALYTNKPLVVCAPTGSGKTVIFELAIVRMLVNRGGNPQGKRKGGNSMSKVVYMAPIKALCTERHEDWSRKFSPLGLECQELTGDSDIDDFWQLQKADIILTTPEKWDSMTRRWRDNTSLVRRVHLFLIDEVHLLNDEARGATMEAVVSRMKTVQSCTNAGKDTGLRFVAVSATIPNTEDIAEWLGTSGQPAVAFDMDESYRPVKLRKVVLGYPWSSNGSEFKFDINLNYKLGNVIHTYSEGKPTLVFCSTRKSVEQAASTLAKDLKFVLDATHKQTLTKVANIVRNARLREMLVGGIGYHHAGLDAHDRHLVEEIFLKGDLLVLVSTSTLAMGVNLPAHLVVVKSTCHYVKGTFQEYTQSEILQMTGRAGRPQFDESATAVIMTREHSKNLYQNIVNGSQKIESSLHSHLIEHLNAEIVLMTICDVSVALEWIRSTFLYIRLLKNPTHYGYPEGLTKEEAESKLLDLCSLNLSQLQSFNLISIDKDDRVMPNEPGRLMARYCLTFDTVRKFGALTGTESLQEMVEIVSGCQEFQEVTLRMNERTTLNKMNKDKNRIVIRFPMNGRIKTTQMKVSCLMQATLGCMNIQDFALSQDVTRIFRNAVRVARCLVELLMLKDDFKSLFNAAVLSKCIKARLWENSRYVTKQLTNIGATLSSALANAGVSTFSRAHEMNPRELELIVNRHAPFGNHIHDAITHLPQYEVRVEQSKKHGTTECSITIQVLLKNAQDIKVKSTAGKKHTCLLLVGDADNTALLRQKISDTLLISTNDNMWIRNINVTRALKGDELSVNLISLEWVGLDVESTYTPYYLGPRRMVATTSAIVNNSNTQSRYFEKKKKPCRHQCSNKRMCAHDCCKVGLPEGNVGVVETHASYIKKIINTPNKQVPKGYQPNVEHLQRFKFERKPKQEDSQQYNQVVPSTPSTTMGWDHLDFYCKVQNQEQADDFQQQDIKSFSCNQPIQQPNPQFQQKIQQNYQKIPQNQPIQQIRQQYQQNQQTTPQFQQTFQQIQQNQPIQQIRQQFKPIAPQYQQDNIQPQQNNQQYQPRYQRKQLSAFDKEQASYDDQINLGGRIHTLDDDDHPLYKERPLQLWTEKGDSQELDSNSWNPQYRIKQMISDQKDVEKNNFDNYSNEDISTNRMGKVFAWKSNTGQRSSFYKPTPQINDKRSSILNTGHHYTPLPPHDVSAALPTILPSQKTMRKQTINNSQHMKPYPSCVPIQPTHVQPSYQQNQATSFTTAGTDTTHLQQPMLPQYNNNLQETSKKRVTFSGIEQDEEEDLLIHCDFDLASDDDDLMMLEACERAETSYHSNNIQDQEERSSEDYKDDQAYERNTGAEGQFELSEELADVGSWSPVPVDEPSVAKSPHIMMNEDQTPCITHQSSLHHLEDINRSKSGQAENVTSFDFWGIPKVTDQVKKTHDLADARKMFDSIFDGIF